MSGKLLLDKNSKDICDKISSLMGIKSDIIKDIWEMTLLAWLLDISDQKGKVKRISIPYLGSVGIKSSGESIDNENSKIIPNYEVFTALSDQFKELLKNVENDNIDEVSSILQDKINHVIENIV